MRSVAIALTLPGCMRFGYDAVSDGSASSDGGQHSTAGAGAAGSNATNALGATAGTAFVLSFGGAEAGRSSQTTSSPGSSAGLAGMSGNAASDGGQATSSSAGAPIGGTAAVGGSSAFDSGGTAGVATIGGASGATSSGGTANASSSGGASGATSPGSSAGTSFSGGSAGASFNAGTSFNAGSAGARPSGGSAGANSSAGSAGTGVFPGGACDWSNGPPAFGTVRSLGSPNTAQPEIDPVVSRDGLTLYFVSYRNDTQGNDIYVASRTSTAVDFDAGVVLSEVNSTANDTHFFVSASGQEAFLASNRAGTLGGSDILRATPQGSGRKWGNFAPIGLLNSANGEYDPHLESDELTLWFAPAGRADGSGLQDLFYSQRANPTSSFAAPLPATSLNSSANEWDVSLTDDGRVIVFRSDRDSTTQVYYAVRASRNVAFGSPSIVATLSPFISTLSDPFVSPDGCAVYFAATLTGGAGSSDLYVVKAIP